MDRIDAGLPPGNGRNLEGQLVMDATLAPVLGGISESWRAWGSSLRLLIPGRIKRVLIFAQSAKHGYAIDKTNIVLSVP